MADDPAGGARSGIRGRLDGACGRVHDVVPTGNHRLGVGLGLVRSDPRPKTRSLMNLAMLTALNRAPEIKLHVKGALNNGVTVAEIKGGPAARDGLLRNSRRARCIPGGARSAGQRGRAAATRNTGQVVAGREPRTRKSRPAAGLSSVLASAASLAIDSA